MRRCVALLSTITLAACLAGCAAPQPVTTRSLLGEMTDLANLAEFPNPPYTCRQFSSYDRASTSPTNAESWFANADCGQYLRTEECDGRTEYVMMDTAGPGAVVRIWSANPKGTLRIYLDHAKRPTLEVPMTKLLGGELPGVPCPIAGVASAGWNCYLPIPYAEHCKITSDEGNFYYHVNYRTYPPRTAVTTFTAADLNTLSPQIAEVAAYLAAPRDLPILKGTTATGPVSTTLPADGLPIQPGQAVACELEAGRGSAIVELCASVSAANRNLALRQLLLRIEFDGEQTVACPLGDFFGAGPGPRPYTSLPLGIAADGELWSQWVMPFRKSARVELRNEGQETVQAHVHILTRDYEWTNRSMHFHAGWHVDREVPTRPFIDWNYITIAGRGRFVGAAFAIANPAKQWWGEGDEKIYVDGETFPSHFGTGTEDYYGYAWCSNRPFTHAYHNQPRCDGPHNYGQTAVNRWHVLDCIPFASDFRFDMELWHWAKSIRVLEMSVLTCWYAEPGATSNLKTPTGDDLRIVTVPPYVAPRVAGATEGEELKASATAGDVRPQAIEQCSNESHLWWTGGHPGDRLVVDVPVGSTGRYTVHARFLKAGDYGIFRLSVNDQQVNETLDLFNDGIATSEEITLGTFDLQAGSNRLGVEIVDANPEAVKRFYFGLDYIRLVPAE